MTENNIKFNEMRWNEDDFFKKINKMINFINNILFIIIFIFLQK